MVRNFQVQAPTESIRQAIINSLICKKAENDSDITEEKAGWWGDCLNHDEDRIGSYLWTLERSILDKETLNKARAYSLEALQWLKDKEVLSSIEVKASEKQGLLNLEITCI